MEAIKHRRSGLGTETAMHQGEILGSRQISSAVSTVLRGQGLPVADAAVAEQCGYGDLRLAVSAVDVWGLDAACGELRRPTGNWGMHSEPWLTGFVLRLCN